MSNGSAENSTRAIWAFVFSLFGITGVCPMLGPIIALVLAAGEQGGLARAARILSWIALVFYGLVMLGMLLLVLIGVVALPFVAH